MPTFPRLKYNKKVMDTKYIDAHVKVWKNVKAWPGLIPFISDPSYEVSYRIRVEYDDQVRWDSVKDIDDVEDAVHAIAEEIDRYSEMEPESVKEQAESIVDRWLP